MILTELGTSSDDVFYTIKGNLLLHNPTIYIQISLYLGYVSLMYVYDDNLIYDGACYPEC